MANLVERISLIMRSNIDELLSKFEDPAKMIDTAIVDEKERYSKLLNQASETFGNEKRAKKELDDTIAKAKQEHELSIKALEKGNEGDAKAMLLKEQELKKEAEILKTNYEAIKKSADMIRKTLDECRKNIEGMEAKAKEIKAKATATKAINQATSIAQSKKDVSVESSFKRLQEKADKEYAEALGKAEYVNSTDDKGESIEEKYMNDTADDGDELLANLKAEVEKKKK